MTVAQFRCLVGVGICLTGWLSASADFNYSARCYVQRGLIGHFDAIENAGYGVHDAAATVWKNLSDTAGVGDLSVAALATWSWDAKGLNYTSGDNNSITRLITEGALSFTKFTFENVLHTGSNGAIRRWEVYPWASTFESWTSDTEGYLERINNTRIAAMNPKQANAELQFATTYDGYFHTTRVYKDGVLASKIATVAKYSFTGRMAFFGGSASGSQAHALRIYDRDLSEEELALNNVIDQLRFLGKTPATATLPSGWGWSFDAAGVLRTASGRVLLRPEPETAGRAITGAVYGTAGEDTTCTVTFGSGTAGVTNALYLAWGASDCGENPEAWPELRRLVLVPPDVDELTVTIPSECATFAANVYTRFFLAEASVPYDHLLEYIAVDGRQYLDTGYFANSGTLVDYDFFLNDLTAQQRPFGADSDLDNGVMFSCSVYFNGGANWAFATQNGKGNWCGTSYAAKKERARIRLDVAGNGEGANAAFPTLTVVSPSYNFTAKPNPNPLRTNTATRNLSLFASARENNAHINPLRNAWFYSCQIYDNGELQRHYLPCVLNGRAALYDVVANTVNYSSTGTDFLAAGGNVDNVFSPGEHAQSTFYLGHVPHGAYRVDTGTTPMTVDYDLFYEGGGSKYGLAPLTLAGTRNGFGGVFTVYEGLLSASFGNGLGADDHLVLNGGLWHVPGGTIAANLGVGAGEVSLTGEKAGFGAFGEDVSVRLGDGNTVAYPTGFFDTSMLVLNDAYCAGVLTWEQALVGSGSDALAVSTDAGKAVFADSVTGLSLTKEGDGELRFQGTANSFANFAALAGSVAFADANGAAATYTGSGTFSVGDASKYSKVTFDRTALTLEGTLTVGAKSELDLRDGSTLTGHNVNLGSLGPGQQTGVMVLDNATGTVGTVTLGGWNGWDLMGRMVLTNDARLVAEKFWAENGQSYQYGGYLGITHADSGSFSLGRRQNVAASYYLYGGTLERIPSSGNFQLGMSGSGTESSKRATGRLYVERTGVLKTHCQYPSYGRIRYAKGELYVRNGGTYYADYPNALVELCVGDEGSGYFEVASGGVVDVAGYVKSCSSYTHGEREGEIRLLTGGLLKVRGIWRDTAACTRTTLIYDGGEVQVNGEPRLPFTENFTEAFVGVAGGVIDTNGKDVTFRQSFAARPDQTWKAPTNAAEVAACAAFTKAGEGTLTLAAPNTYACATCVSNGTLKLSVEGALPSGGVLRLAAGTTVDLSSTSQTVSQLAGAGTISSGSLAVTDTVWPGVGGADGTLAVYAVPFTFTKLGYRVSEDGTAGCLKVPTTVDLDEVEIVIEQPENKGAKAITLIEAASMTGTPVCQGLPKEYRLSVAGNRLMLMENRGTALYIR